MIKLTRPLTEKAREAFGQAKRVLAEVSTGQSRVREFDIDVWFSGDRECGSAGCAGGACALDPWFNRLGLTLDDLDRPQFDGSVGFYALARVFDILDVMVTKNAGLRRQDLVHHLFDGSHYDEPDCEQIALVTPEMVARRIDEILAAEVLTDEEEES